MSEALQRQCARSSWLRWLVAAAGGGVAVAIAYSMHATVPTFAAWLAEQFGERAGDGVTLAPSLDLAVALPLALVAGNLGMLLLVWCMLRHVEAHRRPFGVLLVVSAGFGCYAWVPNLPFLGWTGWLLLASTAMPVVAAVVGLLEIVLRRLPRRELGTAALLLAATVCHQLAWWGLWSMTAC